MATIPCAFVQKESLLFCCPSDVAELGCETKEEVALDGDSEDEPVTDA